MNTIEEFEAAAILNFEYCITDLMTNGAPQSGVMPNREAAIDLIAEELFDGDRELLCFELGLPYGYATDKPIQVQ
jgi:hypothetical protein